MVELTGVAYVDVMAAALLPAVLFGVAFGNILRGVPITEDGMWAGSFFGLPAPGQGEQEGQQGPE